jgi:hypothetical protein
MFPPETPSINLASHYAKLVGSLSAADVKHIRDLLVSPSDMTTFCKEDLIAFIEKLGSDNFYMMHVSQIHGDSSSPDPSFKQEAYYGRHFKKENVSPTHL